MSEIIKNRYEFTAIIEVENGNPNGDPDAGNMPRIDAETGYGIISDVCFKRKIRNYVEMKMEDTNGYGIYIKEGISLNEADLSAGDGLGIRKELASIQDGSKQAKAVGVELKSKDPEIDVKIRDYMCSHYFDIRTFGAVMTTFVKGALNCGQVRGPVQVSFGKSIDPIFQQELSITRVAITTEKDAQNKGTEMGRKFVVPYAVYRVDGYVSANLARKVTGFSEDDLELLWEAIQNMYEHDHSAARGKMAVRDLFIFKHSNELGDCPAYKLFDAVQIKRIDESIPARKYSDYNISINAETIPDSVELIRK